MHAIKVILLQLKRARLLQILFFLFFFFSSEQPELTFSHAADAHLALLMHRGSHSLVTKAGYASRPTEASRRQVTNLGLWGYKGCTAYFVDIILQHPHS